MSYRSTIDPYRSQFLSLSPYQYEISPLEVAIEALHERHQKLKAAIHQPTPDSKGIQLLLQGSVRVSVNSGSIEYARTFLDPKKRSDYSFDLIQRLILEFKNFLQLCQEALELNRQKLIKEDQVEYQEDLEEGFREFQKDLEPFLITSSSADTSKSTVKTEISEVWGFISRKLSMSDETAVQSFMSNSSK